MVSNVRDRTHRSYRSDESSCGEPLVRHDTENVSPASDTDCGKGHGRSSHIGVHMRLRGRLKRKPKIVEEPAETQPELSELQWFARAGELAETRLSTMARRLPALISQALRLAWKANPRDTLVTI